MKVVSLPTYLIESSATVNMHVVHNADHSFALTPKKRKGEGGCLLQKSEKENKAGNKQTSKTTKSSSTSVEN